MTEPASLYPGEQRRTIEPRTRHLGPSELVVKRAADIAPEAVNWLWPPRIAIGKLTIIAGEPGLGK